MACYFMWKMELHLRAVLLWQGDHHANTCIHSALLKENCPAILFHSNSVSCASSFSKNHYPVSTLQKKREFIDDT
ncbi:hypothetical protein ACSBR1_014737 [Camellia fascicularis]